MSLYNPGTSSIKSTNLPAAFVEVAIMLNIAEKVRNGANPGVPAKQNMQVDADFDNGIYTIVGDLPLTRTLTADGAVILRPTPYLGGVYDIFVPGGGDAKGDTLEEAVMEIASMIAAAELLIPQIDRPDNLQISWDEASLNLSATMPFISSILPTGSVNCLAVDYIP